MELETLKTYIQIYLKTKFIYLSMSPAGAFIFFDQKLDASLGFFLNDCRLNNLTIKNRYLL